MVAGLFQALLLVTACSPFEAYNKTCPHSSQRTFRSHDVCSDAPINYSCLFDTNNQNFIEYCNIKPDFAAPGEYYVITGSRRNIECKRTTYQPYSLWSNESRSCAFEKSKCTQSGQVMYRIGSPIEDSQCRCDNTKQYAFVSTPENRCFCIPSKEDCSCFIKQCGFGYILNADYKCKPQSQRNAEKCEAIGNQTTTVEKKTQIGNSSNPTSVTKLEKVIPMQFVSGVSIILLGLSCLVFGYYCEKIGRAGYSNKSDRAKTTNLKDFGDFKVVATIDIGSTFSWYGSSTTEQFKTNPLNISVGETWWNIHSMYLPTKTATCILLGKDGKFKSLGHEAHSQYVELLLDGEADGCLFFDKFKMDLYNNENISDCMLIKDVKGREMKLIDVFSSFISKFMEQVKNSYEKLKPDEIQWVVTVPAVCSDKAKDFMRHCVEKNGVRGNRLIIALESEVVSVYFHYLNELLPKEIPELNRRFVVVDIGGCSVDITAHEKTDDGDLIELCSSTGYTIGGKEVDKNFLALFREIFGNLVMNALSTEYLYLDSYFDILKEIENFKRNFPSSDRKNIFFNIPFSNLNSLCEKYNSKSLTNTIASSKYSKEISLTGDRMIFLRSSLLTLFQPVGERISKKIRQVTEGLKDVDMMLLAGGFSMSPEIVNIIKQSFRSMEIIEIPPKYPADLAVMNGAVLYGHRPQLISSRITKYTYGRLVQPKFKKDRHDPSKLITINGIDLCKDVFETLVNKNTSMNVNETIQKVYKGMHQSQKDIKIFVYTTKKDKVDYVDDSECKLFCEIIVPLSGSSSKHPCIIVDFIFGYSEFRVTAFDKETKVQKAVSVEFK